MPFAITFGTLPLQNPRIESVDWGTESSEETLLSEKTAVQVSGESRLGLTVSGVTWEPGYVSALKSLRGTTASLTIVESPDLLGLTGVYTMCSIVGLSVSPFGNSGAEYVITFLQDTS